MEAGVMDLFAEQIVKSGRVRRFTHKEDSGDYLLLGACKVKDPVTRAWSKGCCYWSLEKKEVFVRTAEDFDSCFIEVT